MHVYCWRPSYAALFWRGQRRWWGPRGPALTTAPLALFQTILPIDGDTATSKTFVIGNEDHTLGNSLRYCIMKECESPPSPCHVAKHGMVGTSGPSSGLI